jgi:ADP-heptose:LPS heptosyltransferase
MRFDCAFDFSQDHRYGLLLKLLGVTKRIGFNYRNRGRFLTDTISICGFSGKHVAQYYLDLLKLGAISDTHSGLTLAISEVAKNKADKILAELGIVNGDVLVGIAAGAGASWGKDAALKHWPAAKFGQLAQMIRASLGVKMVLLGDDAERPIAEAIMSTAGPGIYDLVGKTSLQELAAVLARLSLLITNDGGPLHMAVALGVKTVSLFGPVDEQVYGPYPSSPLHTVITHKVACRPCYQNFRLPPCPNDRVCIRGIEVEEVLAAVQRLLALPR